DSGLLLKTSLSNKHLLPGLRLRNANISIPGQKNVSANLCIEETSRSQDSSNFNLLVSIEGSAIELNNKLSSYLSMLVPPSLTENSSQNRNLKIGKKIKSGLTFELVKNEVDYDKVLKLRFQAYSSHGKVPKGANYLDQGEGLQ